MEEIKYKVSETVVLVNLVNSIDRIYLKRTKAVIVDCYDNGSYGLYFYDNKKPIEVYPNNFKKTEEVVLVEVVKSIDKCYPKGTKAILLGNCGDFHILDFNDDEEPVGVESDYFEKVEK